MSDKCYRVEFTADLHRVTLALKMNCQVYVMWKRGEKVSESKKVVLKSGQAVFNSIISINCNMIFNTSTKAFKEKITKFSVILTSQKGTKQAGEIHFDVAQYINEKQLVKKDYQKKLSGCPDKNAKLSFSLSGVLKQQVQLDAISQNSYAVSPDDNSNGGFSKISHSVVLQSNQTAASAGNQGSGISFKKAKQQKVNEEGQNGKQKDTRVKDIEKQNESIRKQLKKMDKLASQNQQLRKKIKKQEFTKVIDVKDKIQALKEEVQKMKAEIRANRKIQEQNNLLMDDIFRCKIKIMKAFNYLAEHGGNQLVDNAQIFCGLACND